MTVAGALDMYESGRRPEGRQSYVQAGADGVIKEDPGSASRLPSPI